jgi:hypothetical protein
MTTYEDYSQSPDGWNVSATLTLEDDGRFAYTEGWTDYTNASLYGEAEGTWRWGVADIVFRAEQVEGSMYFPRQLGQEKTATERGNALVFECGWTLRRSPERKVEIPACDTVTGPQSPMPPTPPRVPIAEVAQPTAEPTVTRTVKLPVTPPALTFADAPADAQFEPSTPSPELAARLRRWVDELPTEGMENWIGRLCKQNDAIPLHCTQLELWVLRTDGQVLYIDHESFGRRAEPENNREMAYAMLAAGAESHPELCELLPPDCGELRRRSAASVRPNERKKGNLR